jgi:hypothetical protein
MPNWLCQPQAYVALRYTFLVQYIIVQRVQQMNVTEESGKCICVCS